MFAWEKIVKAYVSSGSGTYDDAREWLVSTGRVPKVLRIDGPNGSVESISGTDSLDETIADLKQKEKDRSND